MVINVYWPSEIHAAAAAKSLQSCPTLCNPTDSSPPGSPIPGILQARTLEWVAISFSSAWKWKEKVKSLSCVRLITTPWTAAYQALPCIRLSRQEDWSGVPLPSPSETHSCSLSQGSKMWNRQSTKVLLDMYGQNNSRSESRRPSLNCWLGIWSHLTSS